MPGRVTEKITIENARLTFRNFSGKGDYPGRNFGVALDERDAKNLKKIGWNVKERPPREEGDDTSYYLPVHLRFDINPPIIFLVTSNKKTQLFENDVAMLDWSDIVNVDLTIRPYNWQTASGKSGVKAFAKTMYVTIEEDKLDSKYDSIPVSNDIVEPMAVAEEEEVPF